jgi:hypothetical protein
MLPRLLFNASEQLCLEHTDGRCLPLTVPFTADGAIRPATTPDDVYVLVGASLHPDQGSTAAGSWVRVDFIRLDSTGQVSRWYCNGEGQYTHQEIVEPAMSPPPKAQVSVLNPAFVEQARRRLNDFQIYTLLRHCLGREVAGRYLDGCAAAHGPTPQARHCRLVVIYNHNFLRNCPGVHEYYRARFPEIDFVLPCAAPRHPNYFAYPYGSLQFHGLVYSYLLEQQRSGRADGCDAFLFVQDDLLLHPGIDSDTILALLQKGHGGIFQARHPFRFDNELWMWTPRVRNALLNQLDPLHGNGFEGLYPAISCNSLFHGVSDCFALSRQLLDEFLDRLGPMVAANVFPEVALPTALFNTAESCRQPVLIRPGTLLWGKDRAQASDPEFIRAFIASESMFLHPVKVAFGDSETMRLMREAAEALQNARSNSTAPAA